MGRPLNVHFLGRVPYQEAWALQRRLAERRKVGDIDDTLLLLEHPPVITLGRDGSRQSLKVDEIALEKRGVELVESDRGGDATFHGPGQVVGYPIIDLRPDRKDIRRYVSSLETIMIHVLQTYGIVAGRLAGEPGVWLEGPDRKIAAIGARVSRWVTHHGFALNVNTNMSYFDLIVPCGIADKAVTSLEIELDRRVSMIEMMERLAGTLAEHFERDPVYRTGLAGLECIPRMET
mgnify:CR=1 FL=1